jgi:citrate lyase subunit beta/citryl-CoA lyase
LIGPGDNVKFMTKMSTCAADVCVVDWEDGVLPDHKHNARQLTKEAFTLEWTCSERVIRINGMDTALAEDDLAAAVACRPDSILIPKVQSARDIEDAARIVTREERSHGIPVGTTQIWALIETTHGILNIEQIAEMPRMTAVIFGGGDLGADLRVKRIQLGGERALGPIRHEYAYAAGRMVLAARASGIDPIHTGYTSTRDLDGTRRDAHIAAQFGFTGSVTLSPRQIEVHNEVFAPSREDIAWADEVLAVTDNDAVGVVDGSMVDGPFFRSARHLRELAQLIEQHERTSGSRLDTAKAGA